jgi:Ca-activated chloride channel homolog
LALIAAPFIGRSEQASESATIRTDVNLIVLRALVLDKAGAVIKGLEKNAFKLFVDSQPQNITVFQSDDAPVTAGIVVDNSASMRAKGSDVTAAALAFARASNPEDQMFVVHFSDKAQLALPPEKPFTGTVSELETALARFRAAGTTALYDAITLGLTQVAKGSLDRKVLLVVSDGGDNSSQASLPEVLRLAQRSGVTIYAIGLYDDTDQDRNPRVLTQIAEITGGKAYFPAALKDINQTCVDIAHDIRKQYTLGFAGAEDGKYHAIKLVLQDPAYPNAQVQTRAGYFAPKP